ncbi:MAG: trypsin-like peptidase domain-containing protein [Desulfobacterota bacterium]|nr:trypsin-like peptidase domain-containing protein [Thermodesulfobacteriota bacterium]
MHWPNKWMTSCIVCCIIVVYFFGMMNPKDVLCGAGEFNRRTLIVQAVEKAKDAVVSISTYEQVYERANPFGPFGPDPFFERFFDGMYDKFQQETVRTHLGSGVIINKQGIVVTNWHVVRKASSITVTTSDEKEYAATLVAADHKSDLAILKINAAETFTVLPVADSDNLLIGEPAIAIGNPFGLSHTVTTGVVSALHRSIKTDSQTYEDFIQTDASINPGNSGGPLLNINGELIGINTAIYSEAQGIGFAIPVNTAMRIVNDLLRYGEVRPAWIGLIAGPLARGFAAQHGYEGNAGVRVEEVFPESPAAIGGIKPNDIIISVGDQRLKSPTAYKRALARYTPGSTMKIEVFRDGTRFIATIIPTEIPLRYVERIVKEDIGIEVIRNNAQLARQYGLHNAAGLVIKQVTSGSQAARIGIKPGDILLQVQGIRIDEVRDLYEQILKNIYQESIVVLVQRGMYGYYITFEL